MNIAELTWLDYTLDYTRKRLLHIFTFYCHVVAYVFQKICCCCFVFLLIVWKSLSDFFFYHCLNIYTIHVQKYNKYNTYV